MSNSPSSLIGLCLHKLLQNPQFPFFVAEDLDKFDRGTNYASDYAGNGPIRKKQKVERRRIVTSGRIKKLLDDLVTKGKLQTQELRHPTTKEATLLYRPTAIATPSTRTTSNISTSSASSTSSISSSSSSSTSTPAPATSSTMSITTPTKKPSNGALSKPFMSPLRSTSLSSPLKSPLSKPFKSPTMGNRSSSMAPTAGGAASGVGSMSPEQQSRRKNLLVKIEEVKERIRKTNILMNCQKNGKLDKLESLSDKWIGVCHEATQELQGKSVTPVAKLEILTLLQVDPVLLKHNAETDEFDP